jgi:SNF2 family DNA or RNA helicase
MDELPRLKLKHEPRLDAKHEAFGYQRDAVDFVSSREYSAIFHEQGLGKTKIAIDVILQWLSRGDVDAVVVFTKKILVANWQREFQTHTFLSPAVLSENSRSNYYVFTAPTRVVLGHFEVAKKEIERFKIWLGTRRVAAIIDESAKIKNPDSELTQAFFDLAPLFARRVIMTGTPVANRPYDIWAQIYFLDQGRALGNDFKQFKKDTDLSRDLHSSEKEFQRFQNNLSDINKAIQDFSVRETKDGGRISLPNKEYITISTDWESSQAEMYRQVKEELRVAVIRDGELVEDDQESILKRLLRLVQIASNPKLVDEQYEAVPGKFEYLYDLVTDITNAGEKVIIWTNFNSNCEWLCKRFSSFGALALHGKLPIDRRNAVVRWFLENASDQVLVATPGAAKEGLTLTVANHVVFYDRGYSLDDYLQAQDRIHRVSQVKNCYVYTLIMRDSVDEWIDALLDQKRLAAQLTQGDISANEYAGRATLGFFDILDKVLNTTAE